MQLKSIEVDHNFKEHIRYRDSSFPVTVSTDVYNDFVDGIINCHWHGEFEYVYVFKGNIDFYWNDHHTVLKNGDCVFINSNVMHMSKLIDADALAITVVFPTSLFVSDLRSTMYEKYFQPMQKDSLQGFLFLRNSEYTAKIGNLVQEVYNLNTEEFGYELNCITILSKIWHFTLKYIAMQDASLLEREKNHKHEERAKRILSYIHHHYAENLTIEDIAKSVNVSRSECFRCFKRITNKKPTEYINDYRLAQSARLLRETTDSIAQICLSCGFGSSSYFGKLFKDKFGIAPIKFRAEGQEGK